jgi:hypothetical protein
MNKDTMKNGDRLLFLGERGLYLPADSSYRKSSLSPFFTSVAISKKEKKE